MIHFNVAYPLIGRLIGGLGDPFPSVSSGEIIRIYDEEGSIWALWWLGSVYSFGNLIGPVMVLFFKDVDFHIGKGCSVLFCSILFCSFLFCSVLFCSVLFCSVLFYSVLSRTT